MYDEFHGKYLKNGIKHMNMHLSNTDYCFMLKGCENSCSMEICRCFS